MPLVFCKASTLYCSFIGFENTRKILQGDIFGHHVIPGVLLVQNIFLYTGAPHGALEIS